MEKVVLNITDFREQYPEFKSNVKFPDATITSAFTKATIFFKNETNCEVDIEQLEVILYLMTAHLLKMQLKTLKGQTGLVASATIDKISVSIVSPRNLGEFEYFLNQTPYGQELLALLALLVLGGFYLGGSPETLAFKRAK